MGAGDLVVVTSSIRGSWAVCRTVRRGEVGLIVAKTDATSAGGVPDEHCWWRVLLEDGEVVLPTWAMRSAQSVI
jgi:hypothetical protein